MKAPTEAEILKEFNKNGIFFLEEKSISQLDGRYFGVEIDIGFLPDLAIEAPDFSVSVVNRREVAILFTDFAVKDKAGQKVLTLKAHMRMPDGVEWPIQPASYMSFLDLCFFSGNEAIPDTGYGADVFTTPREGYTARDLGWTMPARFIDTFIDAFDRMSQAILGGTAQEALLYGPSLI